MRGFLWKKAETMKLSILFSAILFLPLFVSCIKQSVPGQNISSTIQPVNPDRTGGGTINPPKQDAFFYNDYTLTSSNYTCVDKVNGQTKSSYIKRIVIKNQTAYVLGDQCSLNLIEEINLDQLQGENIVNNYYTKLKLDGQTYQKNNIKYDLTVNYALLKTIYGTTKIHFYHKHAPNHVQRITQLISQGFYNGLIFHRVISNFVAQTGDPTGTGAGGSGQNINAEFNELPHLIGTVGMARSQNINSADSQFYICLDTASHLNNNYTVFAKVVEGMNHILSIYEGDSLLSLTYHNLLDE
jgi:cyclophilin family peptidyl-prolyl cis-trans isomerase